MAIINRGEETRDTRAEAEAELLCTVRQEVRKRDRRQGALQMTNDQFSMNDLRFAYRAARLRGMRERNRKRATLCVICGLIATTIAAIIAGVRG